MGRGCCCRNSLFFGFWRQPQSPWGGKVLSSPANAWAKKEAKRSSPGPPVHHRSRNWGAVPLGFPRGPPHLGGESNNDGIRQGRMAEARPELIGLSPGRGKYLISPNVVPRGAKNLSAQVSWEIDILF